MAELEEIMTAENSRNGLERVPWSMPAPGVRRAGMDERCGRALSISRVVRHRGEDGGEGGRAEAGGEDQGILPSLSPVEKADLLIHDEPTNSLDIDAWNGWGLPHGIPGCGS
jgi:ABC-type ATPase involved in cell division